MMVGSGTSSCDSTTAADGRSSATTDRFAPDTTMIEFSPLSATPMSARPVATPSTVCTRDRSMPSASITPRSTSAAVSSPSAETKQVDAPARAAATAWFKPLPPGCSW